MVQWFNQVIHKILLRSQTTCMIFYKVPQIVKSFLIGPPVKAGRVLRIRFRTSVLLGVFLELAQFFLKLFMV